jgi:hypothetical protein
MAFCSAKQQDDKRISILGAIDSVAVSEIDLELNHALIEHSIETVHAMSRALQAGQNYRPDLLILEVSIPHLERR